MVKNRKPIFVSEAARNKLKKLSKEQKRYMGDLVDILLNIRTEDEIEQEYTERSLLVKHIRR